VPSLVTFVMTEYVLWALDGTIVDTIHLKGNKFVTGVKIKATVFDSKLMTALTNLALQ